jgi:tetratricopeptide (TPR) repeat protein
MIPLRRVFVFTALSVAVVVGAGPVAADWNTGVDLYNQGLFAEAAEHFQAVVKSNPSWPGGYLMLGRCELALGQTEEALDHLRVAMDLGPDDPANAATLSRALIAADLHTEARELLEGLDLEQVSPPWKAEFARMLARCLLAEDRAADALAVLVARLEDDPDNAALHRAIATAHQAMGDRTAVLDDLARAYVLDPDDQASGRSAITTALALAAAAADDGLAASLQGRALELATTLATAAPEFDNELLAGEAAFAAGQLDAAALWFAAAVNEQPQEPTARYELGRTLAALDRNDEAINHLRAALGAAPDTELAVRIHNQLGRLLACRLELPEAARHYRAAGNDGHAARIDELAASYSKALARLAGLRSDAAELVGMEAELEKLGDANGVTAVAGHRKAMGQEIAAIEDNLAAVRAALCQ